MPFLYQTDGFERQQKHRKVEAGNKPGIADIENRNEERVRQILMKKISGQKEQQLAAQQNRKQNLPEAFGG